MVKDRVHINWFVLMNLLGGYIIGILLYGVIALIGANVQSALYENIMQIVYLVITVTVPSVIYFKVVRNVTDFKREYMQPLRKEKVLSYLWLAVVLWCVGIYLNGLFDAFLERFGILPIEQLTTSDDWVTKIIGFVGVCIAAPVMEEFFFRGVILSGFKRYGVFTAVASSSLLFAFAHSSITVFVLPLIYGSVCAYVARRERSIYPGMLMHAVCNFFSWLFFTFQPSGFAEQALGAVVTCGGLTIMVWAFVQYRMIVRKNPRWFRRNGRKFIRSLTSEPTWIGIFVIYLINNILIHMKL